MWSISASVSRTPATGAARTPSARSPREPLELLAQVRRGVGQEPRALRAADRERRLRPRRARRPCGPPRRSGSGSSTAGSRRRRPNRGSERAPGDDRNGDARSAHADPRRAMKVEVTATSRPRWRPTHSPWPRAAWGCAGSTRCSRGGWRARRRTRTRWRSCRSARELRARASRWSRSTGPNRTTCAPRRPGRCARTAAAGRSPGRSTTRCRWPRPPGAGASSRAPCSAAMTPAAGRASAGQARRRALRRLRRGRRAGARPRAGAELIARWTNVARELVDGPPNVVDARGPGRARRRAPGPARRGVDRRRRRAAGAGGRRRGRARQPPRLDRPAPRARGRAPSGRGSRSSARPSRSTPAATSSSRSRTSCARRATWPAARRCSPRSARSPSSGCRST